MEKLEAGNSKFILDPSRGCHWLDLSLCPDGSEEAFSVISGFNPEENFFGSGCFLMFPWVNRMWPNQFWQRKNSPLGSHKSKILNSESDSAFGYDQNLEQLWNFDGNGYPLHGLVHFARWEKTSISGQFALDCSNLINRELQNPNILESLNRRQSANHQFNNLSRIKLIQTFKLTASKLVVELLVKNRGMESFDFGVGWHPYIKFPIGNVDEWEINFLEDLQEISLDENLLPIINSLNIDIKNKKDTELNRDKVSEQDISFLTKHLKQYKQLGAVKLDNLYQFHSKSRIQIAHPGVTFALELETNSTQAFEPMKYWQIYTPEDRKSIAIEPMSTPGNFENIRGILTNRIEPNKEKKFQFSISLRMKNAF